MKHAWLALLTLVVASMSVGALIVAGRARSAAGNGLSHRPSAARVVIEVVNATKSRGLAKRAATVLRRRGFDVVALANAGSLRDTTLVFDRSGHPEWAHRVATALGTAGPVPRVEERPDSSRYLDITVVLGATWRPPAEPFNP